MNRTSAAFAAKRLLACCVAFAALTCVLAAPAGAVTDSEEFARFGGVGQEAGQTGGNSGMATDPITGHLYVGDRSNNRIDEFTAWGDFVKAFGWGVADGKSAFETCTTTCRSGIKGDGKGQFENPTNVAVDANGNLYVLDSANNRIQKFDSTGQFLLMFGGKVNKTTSGDVCTAAPSDECQAGVNGTGPGEFSQGSGLAISQSGTVVKGDEKRILEFEPNGNFKGEIKTSGTVAGIAPDRVDFGFYVIFLGNGVFPVEENVRKLSSSGAEEGSVKVHQPRLITTDLNGNLYVAKENEELGQEGGGLPQEVYEYSSGGALISGCCAEGGDGVSFYLALTINTGGDLYVASRSFNAAEEPIAAFGPVPTKFGPPPIRPPQITSQFATSVDDTSATLRAQVNPNFWADTRIYVEYGLEPCASSSCDISPPPPGQTLGAGQVKKVVTSPGVVLSSLTPGSTYHYRFVAESSGGGPVRGAGGEVGVDGAEGTFTTFSSDVARAPCSNDAFRTGPAARLPDCRGYEMVSPVEKNNGDILAPIDITGYATGLFQSSTDGEKITYSSYRAFGDSKAAPYISQYIAKRGAGGWASETLSASRGASFYGPGRALENEYKAFSPDLCQAWLQGQADPPLAPGAIEGFPNLYRRQNCSGGYEALTMSKPSGVPPVDYLPEIQGYSADGSKTVFRAAGELTEDASPGKAQAYEANGSSLSLLCILPNELPYQDNCTVGSPPPNESKENRGASLKNAISADGSKVYWSATPARLSPGKLYLRVDGTSTVKVSEAPGAQSTFPAQFWGASADGMQALFTMTGGPKAGNLYRYEFSEEGSSLIAGKVLGVAAASEDLSYVYFVSEEALGGEGTSGQPNLYLAHEGAYSLIGSLSKANDIKGEMPSVIEPAPIYHAAQATPDGRRLVFISTEPLSGADNRDLKSGEADSQVFIYDADSDRLDCVSCSPAGVRPAGRLVGGAGNSINSLWTAGWVAAAYNQLTYPRVVSENGSRVFFNSYTSLLPTDTNGEADVYEWERSGAGDCSEESASFSVANGGCISLITSGESPEDSEFVDSSPDGRDAFFTTTSSLRPEDPGLIDLYDARSGGGYPSPSGRPVICEGEACQGPLSPPDDPTPASSSFEGAGNVTVESARKKRKHHKRNAHKKVKRGTKHNRHLRR